MLRLQLGPIGAAREGARYHPLREGARNGRVHVEQRAVVLESHLEVRRFPGGEGVRWHGPTRSERVGAYARKCGKLVMVFVLTSE